MTNREDITGTTVGALSYSVALTYNGAPLDLSTVNGVLAVIKPGPSSLDSAGKSYTVGAGLTVVSSPGGTLTWVIPNVDVGANKWYRIDVIDTTSAPNPAVYGTLTARQV